MMNKPFLRLIAVVFLLTVLSVQSKEVKADRWGYLWDTKAHNKGQIHISYGYGIPRLENSNFKFHKDKADYRVIGVGPFAFKAEYGLSRQFSIGLSCNYIKYTSDWRENRFDSFHQRDLPFTYGTIAQDISIMLRMNYHWVVNHRTDVYIGGGMGYNHWIAEDFTTNAPDDSTFTAQFKRPMPAAFEMTAGIRYYFRSRNAVYLEAGYGKSLIQGGFVFKFRQWKKQE
jgi:opacity protein-like surface antigen